MSDNLSQLQQTNKGGYWYREKYTLDGNYGSIDYIRDNFVRVLNNIEATPNPDEVISLTRFKDSVTEVKESFDNPIKVFPHLLTSLNTVQSLRGINGAFNSRKYTTASALFAKGNNFRSVRELKWNLQFYNQFNNNINIAEAANVLGLIRVPDIVGQTTQNNIVVYPKIPLATNHLGVINFIKKVTILVLEWAGVPDIGSSLPYWITSSVSKTLGMSGSKAARYLAASQLRTILPGLADKAPAIAPVTAWSYLSPYLPIASAIAILIVVMMKLRYKDKLQEFSKNVLYLSNDPMGGHKYKVEEFPQNEEEYIKEVQRYLPGYSIAIGIDDGIPVIGVTMEGKLPKEKLQATYDKLIKLHNLRVGKYITKLRPNYIDYKSQF